MTLRLRGIEVSNKMLEKIEDYHDMGAYELIEELEEAARDRLQELYNEAKE